MRDSGISRAQSACLSVALTCVTALACACSSEPLDVPKPQSLPILGCETLDVTPCDTQLPECQQSRLEIAACLRETSAGALPTITRMTEQEYVDYINTTFAGRDVATNHFEVAMTWLGLAQPGSFSYVPIATASIADWFGSYRWRQKDLLVIDHGRPSDDLASNVELVATLIRALRDRDINIGMWSTVVAIFDIDSNWGGDAMYFGEARFFSNRYKAAVDGVDPVRFDEFAYINAGIRQDIDWIRTQPSPYVATNSRFPQNFGARATYLAWHRNGVDGVNALYDDKLITQQLMASETKEGPAPTLKYHGRPRAPSQWDQDPIVTAVGAWGLFLSLSGSLEPEAAWALALKWSGEQLFVYKGAESNPDDTALVWQLEMADEASASALQEELKSSAPAAQLGRRGSFVTFAIASSEGSLDWSFVDD